MTETQQQQAADGLTTSMFVAIKDIAVIDRQRKDMKDVQGLANSILETGRLIHPINLRRPNSGDSSHPAYKGEPWVLVTGGRRLAAHMVLQRDTIEARDFGSLDPLMQQIIELRENLDRAAITWQEEVEAKARIHELRGLQNPGQTITATAKELGEDKANTSRDVKLADLIKADPTLRSAPSKASAVRKATFKAEMQKRVDAIKSVDIGDLTSRIVTADMRDFVRTIPSQSVDLVYTDFPFGIDYDKTGEGGLMQGAYRDDPQQIKDLIADVVPHICRIVKPTGWIACMMGFSNYQFLADLFCDACATHANYRTHHTDKVCDGKYRDGECRFLTPEELPWIWYRPNSRQPSLYPERHANNQYEMFCIVNGGDARLVTPNVPNVLAIDAVYTDRIHGMQRPHALGLEVIKRLTLTGELVVDLCYGSGAALASAADLGRQFLGCDINPDNRGPALQLVAQYYKKAQPITNEGAAKSAPIVNDELGVFSLDDLSAEELEAIGE